METEISSFWFVLSHGWFLTYGHSVPSFCQSAHKDLQRLSKGGGEYARCSPARPHSTCASECIPGAGAFWKGENGVLWSRIGNHKDLISASFMVSWSLVPWSCH